MAGDWIKMRATLQTHPKVVRIASALNADRLRVVGALHAVWCLFDAHSVDGVLEGYTPLALDDLVGWPGFTAAMAAVTWLEISAGSLSTPRFDAHNGQSAKRRAQESERKREVRNLSAADADKKRTREEKKRINTPLPPAPAGAQAGDQGQRPPRSGAYRWKESWDGIKGRGEQLGIVYDTAALGSAWTSDVETAFRRDYTERVTQADKQARASR